MPAVVAGLSIAGLIFALVGDGIWDALSWVTLVVPILLFVAGIARGRVGLRRRARDDTMPG
jgi:hypothetical protein